MAEEKPPDPLTPEQTREALKHLTKQVLAYGAELTVLRRILLEKGLVTEAEIARTADQVHEEGREQIRNILASRRQKRSGDVQ